MKKVLIMNDDIYSLPTTQCRGLVIAKIDDIGALDSSAINKQLTAQLTHQAKNFKLIS